MARLPDLAKASQDQRIVLTRVLLLSRGCGFELGPQMHDCRLVEAPKLLSCLDPSQYRVQVFRLKLLLTNLLFKTSPDVLILDV